ncbi:hypothetical protein NDU88_002032 [Pleurodeles waltl]|uniref:Uncharacterized protein n=1 Tax=Pleurodeles waltl TaxID=8319 RepID=A0AAV7R8Y5_PLEWA|nr:hypothetical protein NDU88_002032 [Pleurodeles waltl]
MLLQSDPPYPGGITTQDTSDPEVLRAKANPILRPGNGRQKQPLCAVTWLKQEEPDCPENGSVGTGIRNLGKAADGERSEEHNGCIPDGDQRENSRVDLMSSATTEGSCRGPGGTNPNPGHAQGRAWPVQFTACVTLSGPGVEFVFFVCLTPLRRTLRFL